MANFNIQITNRGRALQAKAQAGTPLVFTRMRLGSGSLSGQQISDLTALIDPKLWLAINKSVASSTGKHTVGAYLKSDNVTTGFYFREWGIFAQDPDLGEILYSYGNVGTGAEYIAAGGGSDSVEKQLDAITIIGNAANVSAVLDESLVFPSRREFEDHQTAAELDHPDGSVTTAKLADGAATDDKIGDRTISDATAPTTNTAKLTSILSGIAHMIKAITGGGSWRTLPTITLSAIKTILDAATNAATANTIIKRDANGRAKVAAPSATDDIARKAEVDSAITTAASDATTKANAAQSAAITAAATDATNKADAALSAAKDYSVNAVAPSATAIDPNTTQYEFIVSNHANAPINGAFWYIRTWFYASKFSSKSQIAIQYNGGSRLFTRSYYEGTWTAWSEQATTGYVDTAVSTASTAANNAYVNAVYNGGTNVDPNTTELSFIVTAHANGPTSAYYFIHTYFLGNKAGNKAQLAITYYSANPRIFIRTSGDGTWYGWRELAQTVSPNFTGTPTTGHPAAATSNNQIPTTAWTKDRIAEAAKPIIIPASANLNSYITEGLYYTATSANANTVTNKPPLLPAVAFGLEVVRVAAGWIVQIVTNIYGSRRYYRYFNGDSSTWGSWYTEYDSIEFTGVNTAVTAPLVTKDKQLATTEFVHDVFEYRTMFGVTAGTSTAYTLKLSPELKTLYMGTSVKIKLHVATGTNPTLNVSGLGAKALYAADGTSRFVGVTGRIYTFVYDGTNFILASGGGWNTGDIIPLDKLAIETGSVITQAWADSSVGIGQDVAIDIYGNVYCANSVSSGKTLRKLTPTGEEIWANTELGSTSGVAVDSSGNVYCVNNLISGKTVRKFNSNGAELWSKTDVQYGRGVAVDALGNVYCAHGISSGKAVRKLNSSGTEVWSNTLVANGEEVVVDSSGNVYSAHSVSNYGKSIRKLNSSGTEIWGNTDSQYGGNGVAVDESGNVYCGNSGSIGQKTIRKLNSSGVEVWANTDGGNGNGVDVDRVGNVYCANGGGSSKLMRKLNPNGVEVWGVTGLTTGASIKVDSASGNVYCAHSGTSSGVTIRKLFQNILGHKVL